jgi:hypothetical protein
VNGRDAVGDEDLTVHGRRRRESRIMLGITSSDGPVHAVKWRC